jgi:hypothetical protein
LLAAVAALLLAAVPACSDSSPATGDANTHDAGRDGPATDARRADGPATDARRADGPATDAARRDGVIADARRADGPTSDAPRSDARVADSRVVDGARDVVVVPDAANALQLKVRIDSTYAWANLQPPTPPDPTHVTVTLTFKNTNTTPITNIAIPTASLSSTKQPVKVHPLQGIKPVGTFSGTLAGGATVQVQYTNTPSTQSTPVAFGCNDKVELSLKVASSGGAVALSTTTSFNCVY